MTSGQATATVVKAARARRAEGAWTVEKATEFSSDRILSDPIAVVLLFEANCPNVSKVLIEATTPER